MRSPDSERTRSEILIPISSLQSDRNHVREVEICFLVNEPARAQVDRITRFTGVTRRWTIGWRSFARIDHHTREFIDHYTRVGNDLLCIGSNSSLTIDIPALLS